MRRQAIVLNVTTYDAAISAWEKGRQRQQVLQLSCAMQRHAFVLSMVTYIGLTPLTSDAALGHRAGRDLLRWRYQCVRKGPAAPAGQTIVTTGL